MSSSKLSPPVPPGPGSIHRPGHIPSPPGTLALICTYPPSNWNFPYVEMTPDVHPNPDRVEPRTARSVRPLSTETWPGSKYSALNPPGLLPLPPEPSGFHGAPFAALLVMKVFHRRRLSFLPRKASSKILCEKPGGADIELDRRATASATFPRARGADPVSSTRTTATMAAASAIVDDLIEVRVDARERRCLGAGLPARCRGWVRRPACRAPRCDRPARVGAVTGLASRPGPATTALRRCAGRRKILTPPDRRPAGPWVRWRRTGLSGPRAKGTTQAQLWSTPLRRAPTRFEAPRNPRASL